MSLSEFEVGPVFAVSDLKAATDFYEGKLGLTPSGEGPDEIRVYDEGD